VFSRTASLPSTRGGNLVSQASKDGHLDNSVFKARTDKIIFEIVKELDNLPINPETGSIYRGSAKKIIDQCIVLSPWLTRDMIHSKRNRMKQALQKKGAGTVEGDSTKKTNLEQLKSVPKGGRKKGTTNVAIRQNKRKFNDMKNDIVGTWVDKTKRPSNRTLKAFIEQKQKEFGFDTGKPDHNVTVSMVESRMKRNRIQIEGPTGQRSPLYSIEPRLVMFLKLASDCNQEMTEAEILDFVNTYISGSKLEQEIIDWKLRNIPDSRAGIETLAKLEKHQRRETELSGISDEAARNFFIWESRKAKEWMASSDYLTLIKFKKLGFEESAGKGPIPFKLDKRKHLWHSKYAGNPHPMEPRKPDGYSQATVLDESVVPEAALDGE